VSQSRPKPGKSAYQEPGATSAQALVAPAGTAMARRRAERAVDRDMSDPSFLAFEKEEAWNLSKVPFLSGE
jgi:hypothetical protein